MINIKESIHQIGEYEIFSSEKGYLGKFKNRIMDVALNAMANILIGTSTDLIIKYLAIGASNTAITDSDIKLGNEVFRTPKLSLFNYAVGSIQSDFIILDSDYAGTIQEIGIFASATATSTKDSGILISRILWNYSKTSTEELNFRRTDRVVR